MSKMGDKILITGGAGFIGSHLCDMLINKGHKVTVLDNLNEQVHGTKNSRPEYLHPEVELIKGDIRNKSDVKYALTDIDVVYHLAARVGVGQSMYEISEYTAVNNMGTAILLEAIIEKPVDKLVVASSMSIYGEGLYRDKEGETVTGSERKLKDLRSRRWEMYDNQGRIMIPVPTHEEKIPTLSSVYALSKYDQERMCLMIGRAYNFPVVALRFFNVYGTRQALSNPYTGVLAIFASRLLNEKPPMIFEDGNQKRDFVHVEDVAHACILAAESAQAGGQVFNIGSGRFYTINEIAQNLAEVMGKEYINPEVTGKYRSGDIRHCFSDIQKAKDILGYSPEKDIKEGLAELAVWLKDQIAHDKVDVAGRELEDRGLSI